MTDFMTPAHYVLEGGIGDLKKSMDYIERLEAVEEAEIIKAALEEGAN